ncbi:MAG: VCBS repeat-containing protein [Planctomycetales bacterium]|nr:VCBS repeat-containing protein [Planctomycetales bacterium]
MSRLYHSGYVCGGVAVGDVDGDGRLDIYLVSGPEENRLYRQVDDFQFEDITGSANVSGERRWGTGATFVDIDNDDDLDIYICNYDAPNQLYINDGRGRFTENAAAAGLNVHDACLMPSFCDYDRDGDLDVYLLTNRFYRAEGRPTSPPVRMVNGKPVVLPEYDKYYALRQRGPNNYGIDDYGREDLVLRNNGDGTFTDVTRQSGVQGYGYGLSVTWWDYNADGWPDIYVCNDFDDPDRLYHNNGDGTFRDVLREAFPHTSWFSMGSDSGDINNDGRLDFFAVDMSATNHYKQKTTMGAMNAAKLAAVAGPPPQIMRNALLINTGTGRFWESAYLSGVADSDWSWSPKIADFDNDGWLDIFISNGMVRNFNDSDVPFNEGMLVGRSEWDIFKATPPRPEQNLAFRNQGNLRFVDVSKEWGLDHVGMSYGTALADLDGDGDLDLITVNIEEPVSIFRNETAGANSVTVQLQGSRSNRHGWGARLELASTSGQQVRQLHPVTGFLSCNEAIAHFGLGRDEQVTKLVIEWPSGIRQELTEIAANQRIIVSEPNSEPTRADEKPVTPLFARANRLTPIDSREQPFDDFARQPLLPNQLSQLGPGLASGDIDGDGDVDFFLGGPAGQAGRLWLSDGQGGYQSSERNGVFEPAAKCEDMGALLFDADGDGDVDLYVVSGGVECEPGDDVLQDRLYWNGGSGDFELADADTLPNLRDSGSSVCAADFDRDGDLDLFVGSRSIPGQYPLSPQSRLLRNEGGRFTDVTAELAPALLEAGLVGGAVWTDLNSDGWIDLALAVEWGPVRILINDQGGFADATEAAGIFERTGWWNGIAARDIDGDEDIDLVATNFGLNTKYHASLEHPALLYYGDFEKNGKMHLVEAEFEDETLFPIRGKSCSTRAMPSLARDFSTYHTFAVADLQELYTEQCLDNAHRFAATTLESGTFINDGTGHFTFRPWPSLAQVSPGFGVVLTEVNGDRFPDVYVAQNFFTPQPETGRMDSGMSLLMLGAANGAFHPVGPDESGLVVTDDAKSLIRADLDGDGQQDFLIASNSGPVQAFLHSSVAPEKFRTVRLVGASGNPSAIGARVSLVCDDGSTQTDEVRCGGGYLSQSDSAIVFGVPDGVRPIQIKVVWPAGETSEHTVESTSGPIVIRRVP